MKEADRDTDREANETGEEESGRYNDREANETGEEERGRDPDREVNERGEEESGRYTNREVNETGEEESGRDEGGTNQEETSTKASRWPRVPAGVVTFFGRFRKKTGSQSLNQLYHGNRSSDPETKPTERYDSTECPSTEHDEETPHETPHGAWNVINNGSSINAEFRPPGGISQAPNTTPATLIPTATPVDNNFPRAEPVTQAEEPERHETQPDHDTNRSSCWFAFKVSSSVAGLIALSGVLLVLIVVFSGTKSEYPKGPAKIDWGRLSNRERHMLSLLSPEMKGRIDLPSYNMPTTEVKSPQTRAFNWTMNDTSFDKYRSWRLLQRYALACLYFSTGGDSTWLRNDGWLDYDTHEDDWFRVDLFEHYKPWFPEEGVEMALGILKRVGGIDAMLRGDSEAFQHLWLLGNGLEGTIPPELFLLTSLRSVQLSNNAFSGSFPSEIGYLSDLQILAVANTTLTGLPTELGLLRKLVVFYAQDNTFGASIPSEIMEIPLFWLGLRNAGITGTIPTEIGLSTMLISVYLDGNDISSTLPSEIGKLGSLMYFDARDNRISGSIPTEMGLMLENPIRHQDKYFRFLRRNFPFLDELGIVDEFVKDAVERTFTYTSQGVLLLKNQLSGTIPSELGMLSDAEEIWLARNSLTGTIPSELGLLTGTKYLLLEDNQLAGSIPSELGLLSDLLRLSFSNNDMTGSIPSELGLLTSLQWLDLSRNRFQGIIPTSLEQLTALFTPFS